MKTIGMRFALFTWLVLLLGVAVALAQDEQANDTNQAISPLSEGTCPNDVPTWAASEITVDALTVASGIYSAEELAEFLNLGQPDERSSLPLAVRTAQELVAYRLNLMVGYPGWVESDLAASEAEDFLELTFGGLPSVSDETGGEGEALLAYLNEVLANYNLCGAPVF